MKKITSALVALGMGIALSASVQANTSDEAVVERIKAVGSVCIEGDDSCGGAAPVAAAGGAARSGDEVYNTKCAACHATGAAGAPKFGTSDWADREAKGLETLVSNAINGFKGMPPRGLCADCSDDEIKASIEHMLAGSK